VAPAGACVPGQVNQAVICSGPDSSDVQGGRCDCINDAALNGLRGRLRSILADALRNVVGLAREIRTNLLPVLATISRLPQSVCGEEQRVWIDGRKDYRLRAQHAKVRRTKRLGQNVLCLVGAAIITRKLAAINNLGVERI